MEKYNEVKDKIPLLRFRNFQQCKSWNKGTIDSIIECESSQLTLGKLNLSDKGYPIYGADGIIGYITFYNKNHMYISIVKDGSGVGRLNLCQAYSSLLGTLNYLFSKDEKAYQIQWIYYLLQTIDFSNYIKGSGIPHIYFNDYKKHIIYIPSFDEQREIADCLSSLDELIEATAQKVETLKEHKKGLMQRLFPAEGKNVPDLRFSEFQGMKGWEKKQVKDFGEVITGNTPSKKEGKYWNGDFVWVTAQDFKGKYINDSILKLTKFGKDKARVIPKDSVLVTCIASIGLNAINKVECSTNQQINTICCNKEYYYEYVYYLVTYNTKNLKQLAGQTAVPIITKKSFEEFEVYAIDNYDEQQKIADCLSSLDELIEVISRKVEILKEYKKGLMQQLFPKI